MAKKFYAVKIGLVPGIYTSWEDCKKNVDGYPNAVFKGFALREDAESFLQQNHLEQNALNDNKTIAYVDGSFDEQTGRYAFGAVILDRGKEIYLYDCDDDPNYLPMRNIAGEIMGAVAAMHYAVDNNLPSIKIMHDYQGISSWCLGEWQTKAVGTAEYVRQYISLSQETHITFEKVKGHSGVYYNELADALAKYALGIQIKQNFLDLIEKNNDSTDDL